MASKIVRPVIALLSDFGKSDSYVASMKAVILRINPDVQIIDITHDVPAQDIASGAHVIQSCYDDFPSRTIFVCVVDPGVGSKRRAIAVKTKEYVFIGPDNGLLSGVVRDCDYVARKIENQKWFNKKKSSTFHGRDIFSPAAAHLSLGGKFKEIGSLCRSDLILLNRPVLSSMHGQIAGEIVHVDHFGNLITNIHVRELKRLSVKQKIENLKIYLGRKSLDHYPCYADAPNKKLFSLIGSNGYLEIALKDGSAIEMMRGTRSKVRVKV